MTDAPVREDTMIYRKPAPDSDPSAISNIWGRDLETKVVDAPEVDAHLAEGWVRHPDHLENPPKEPNLPHVKDLQPALDDATRRMAELSARIEMVIEQNAKLKSDLQAAEELAAAESKAKDEALAKLSAAEGKQGAKTKP